VSIIDGRSASRACITAGNVNADGLTEIAGLDIDGRVKKTGFYIAGLDNGGPDIDGRIPLPSKVKQ